MIGQILRILRYHFMPASEERKKLDRHEMILLELQTQNRQILRKQELIIEQLNGATSTKRHQSSQLMPFAYAQYYWKNLKNTEEKMYRQHLMNMCLISPLSAKKRFTLYFVR